MQRVKREEPGDETAAGPVTGHLNPSPKQHESIRDVKKETCQMMACRIQAV